jgi:hypothetical protein
MIDVPEPIRKALEHVRSYHPDVTQVVFFRDSRWLYFTDDLLSPQFGPEIDVGVLEDAADAVPELPMAYAVRSPLKTGPPFLRKKEKPA